MSAPYWGQLPPPKAAQTKARRLSDDLTSSNNRRQSLDGGPVQSQSQSQPRSNRVSVQTTKSDAPTDSTLSPFVSPTASSFQGQGLAPRPPSLPYAANQYPPELIENRRRRRSRNQEQDYDYTTAAGPPPPAAPDVPRAPPVSYKYPPGKGGPPLANPVPPPGPPRPPKEMDSEEYRVPPAAHKEENSEASPRQKRNITDPTLARNTMAREDANGHQRRASGAEQNLHRSRRISGTGRPKTISKEDKRARAKAAERAAREKAVENGTVQQAEKGPQVAQQVRFQELQSLTTSQEEDHIPQLLTSVTPVTPITPVTPTRTAQSGIAQRGPLSQNPPEEGRMYGSGSGKSPRTQAPESRIPVSPGAHVSGIPQRNLSFRERAAKTDVKLPNGFDDSSPPKDALPAVTTPNGTSLTRSGSNKLKKNPPGDPWFNKRKEIEEKYPTIEIRTALPVHNTRGPEEPADPVTPSFGPGLARASGPGATDSRSPPGRADREVVDDYDDEDEVLTPPVSSKLVKTASQRKADQILGRGPAQHQQHLINNGARRSPPALRNAPPPAAATRGITGVGGTANTASHYPARRDARSDSDSDDAHHVSNLVYRARDKFQPGHGLFAPPKYLEEWKTATVGTLSGANLELDDVPPTVEKGQTWWEGSTQGKRRGSNLASRPKKAEAFEGEYDDTNGKQISNSQYDCTDVPKIGIGVHHQLHINDGDGATSVQPKHQDELHTISSNPGAYASRRLSSCLALCSDALPICSNSSPTRFKPPLYLKCGPLLRYCGIRHERVPSRSTRNGAVVDKEIWRGSVMIVTTDADSSYDIAPTLRLFVQPLELLPPPPTEINGDEPLAPEYVDPIAGHPKLGRKGETLYVRPADHLEEAKDLSRDDTDDGLFEKSRSPPDVPLAKGLVDPPGSYAARRKRAEIDGEKVGKYRDVRGFRLHAEQGYTFWRFNIEVELREKQQRIAYRINRGPSTGFWVPSKGQTMNIMFHSCNGFSMSVNPDQFSGPDPMWRDVLNTHQSQPFHVMIGGGDQIYNDRCMQETKLFKEWLMIKNPLHKHNAPFTPAMQSELETFYMERYAMWFSQGLFGMANSQIPMVNMFDDHDIIDGYGSYPHHFMNTPVFSGIGNVAFKYYMLFQHQSVVDETEKTEPSWMLGSKPGPYINELSRSLFMFLGSKVALLAIDARTERRRDEVVSEDTWRKIMDRCYIELDKGKTEHLLVLLGVPIAYPRLVWLENILTSRLMDPVKALGKAGLLGNFLNRFDGGVEVLDDLDDHWTAKNHKDERKILIEDLQDLAADKSIRVTILSGDVHLAAIGQFYSNAKLGVAKHKDFRYMPNVVSSAIVNTPPPDLMADVLNKRNKIHHFDKETDEDMIPIFAHGVDGKPRNNKHLLPHRNWCSIREYVPGNTPLPTPDGSAYDLSPVNSPMGAVYGAEPKSGGVGGMLRRLSFSKTRNRGPSFRGPDGVHDRSRPPVSRGILRALTARRGVASADEIGHYPQQQKPPGLLNRTLSGSSIAGRVGGMFRRRSSTTATKRRDDGGINGSWGDTDEEDHYEEEIPHRRMGLRGGGTHSEYDEYEDGDESYFSARAPGQQEGPPGSYGGGHHHEYPPEPPVMSGAAGGAPLGMTQAAPGGLAGDVAPEREFAPKAFHRTPTGLSAKQRKRADELAVNLEGGLEVCLNVEISQRDPGGSTVPYRLVVPKLWYEYEVNDLAMEEKPPVSAGSGGGGVGGIKRLINFKRG
ncbi:hypothetical protein B0T17DRAFT_495623 [Bombardia bombarda]|uniref:PhoD-like phosphatase domain-containing protein n=1 Tax=Bombardia bombarda TaxID=252184 RepID=A0AA39WN83_9PEZI|nr:hypothetical protein B0T17DRAFT_495623 [Bombardia bombarda]